MRSIAFLFSLVVAGSAHAQQVNHADPKSPPAAAPGRDEASQRKLDDAAIASQRKLADERLARSEAQWKRVMRSICTGC
jgi:hypothetical protein